MTLIATKVLSIGFVVAAVPGSVVSPDAVALYGWQDGVTDVAGGPAPTSPAATGTESAVAVKSYGAHGDGVADDSAAIQRAIDASPAGSKVLFDAGTYLVSAPIVLRAGRTYSGGGVALAGGAGGAVIRLKNGVNLTNGAGLTGLLVAQAWSTDATACDLPIRVENLCIDGNSGNNTGSTAAGIILCNYGSVVQGCYVIDTPSHGLLLTDTTANGSNVITNSASENRILQTKISRAGGHGIAQVCANNISNQDGFCVDNLIDSTGGDGINFQRGSGWVLRRNHLYDIAGNGINLGNCYASTLDSNEVEDFGGANADGTWYMGISVSQLNGRGTTVVGNFIGCAEPASHNSHYQYLVINANSGQADANAVVVGNVVHGPDSPTGNGIGVVVQHSGGGVMKCELANNRVSNVNTPYYIAPGDSAGRDQSLAAPQVTVAAGAQASAASASGGRPATDRAGQLDVTTVGSPAAGPLATVTFGTAYESAPLAVNVTAQNAAAASAGLYVSAKSASAFTVSAINAPAGSAGLTFCYRVTA